MIESLPFFHAYDPSIQRLTLRGAVYIPDEIFQFADKIKILDITGGTVSELPVKFSLLGNLFAVFLGENNFKEFPKILSQCKSLKIISIKNGILERISEDSLPKSLEWLVFTNNPNLKDIPVSIGNLENLQKLALAGTGISSLPDSLIQCKKLEFLRISACQFLEIPNWVYNFPRLAWFSDEGNPVSLKKNLLNKVPHISESDFQILECINESNISRVSRGKIFSSRKEVVIKDYKNTITSDGYAIDDITASIAIGRHPNLITVVGIMIKSGNNTNICLISELIPSGFKKLGLPPTLQSCTRDKYDENVSFTVHTIINILIDISAACWHIHKLGISHGDIYAHNILIDSEGNSILTDFGAATFYNPKVSPVYEYYDIRAFGNLMDELMERIIDNTQNEAVQILLCIKNACISENIISRLNFSEINSSLRAIDKLT